MIFLTLVLLIAFVTADVLKRPYVDALIRKNLCYSGTAPTTIPTVSVFDVKSQLSNTNGLLQTSFCNSLQLGDLRFSSENLVSTTCSTSGFTTTVVILTTPKAPTTPSVTHQLTCKFNVQIDRTCSSSSSLYGYKDNDNDGRWHKRQMADNLPCSGRRTKDACLAECTNVNFLFQCTCLFDNRAVDPQDVSCPANGVCCWNMPCEKWNDQFQCLRGGGSLDGVTPQNCAWSVDSQNVGQCNCAAPLVHANYTLADFVVFNPTLPYDAPFDCLCPYVPVMDWLNAGGTKDACLPAAVDAPTNVVRQIALSLGLNIEQLNVGQYGTNCKPCSIKIGGRKGTWTLASKLCNIFLQLVRRKNIPFLTQKVEYGCGIIAEQSQCSSLVKDANNVVGEDQLDQVPVEMIVDAEDVPATAASGSIATVSSVAVLIAAIARLL